MDKEITQTEDKIIDRRSALKALFGLAAVAAGASVIMAPGAAEAAPVAPSPAPAPATPKQPEMAKDADLPPSDPTQYYYYRRRRPRYVVRRRYYVRPRRVYRRRVYVRRIYW
ncbi:MAG TPA: twin-arginine translocation signal domain-containing protein [Rhabdaerophilum sp.]|nr:twin-arginine translocation signal domain-containing protein [Rhabdaerophilum sp.]